MASERVGGTADGESAAIEDVGVDRGSGDVFVDEKFLNHLNVGTGFKKVSGQRAAKNMDGDSFRDAQPLDCKQRNFFLQ